MSIEEEIAKYLPKQLSPLIFSFILDAIELDEINNNISILTLKIIECSNIVDEPTKYPSIRDVKLYQKSFKLYENMIDRLSFYMERGSEYLVRKFICDESAPILIMKNIINNYCFEDIFKELNFYTPYYIAESIVVLWNSMSNDIDKYKLNIPPFKNELLKLLPQINKDTAAYFVDGFHTLLDEDKLIEIFEMNLMDDEDLAYSIGVFISWNCSLNMKKAQKVIFPLIKESEQQKKFIEKFGSVD